ncbi:hypothetical protein [Streptomyces sp. JJ36]|uniref:hypothetical protein n=1 Tax=Streptomyces sp. JJ36 TaxID=2736645 RepID=UPI001F3081A9|nr:hypothetical protein [Streptomyces sp. JJ36]MCF6522639.1 hypothetical protein [Streptomyces sp. JJ36]
MTRKKIEGDEDQKRAAAHEAARAGETASERKATTGASRQRTHVPDTSSLSHQEKTAHLHEGKKQGPHRQETSGGSRAGAAGGGTEEPTYRGRGRPGYTEQHERVFRVLTDAERSHGGEGVHLQELARDAGLPQDETRTLLHDLTTEHGLVTELQGTDSPDMGPRYETRPGL